METKTPTVITVETTVNAPVEKVWKYFTSPEHITKWNAASDDWHSPTSTVDLREGGSFTTRMEAKDGSMGFDFGGIYNSVKENSYLEYTMGDGRKAKNKFTSDGDKTKVSIAFDAESQNSEELQRGGWQAILDNFRKYTEEN